MGGFGVGKTAESWAKCYTKILRAEMDEDEGDFPEHKGSDAPGGKDEVDPPPSFKRRRITDH
jgi:hypothetical protein